MNKFYKILASILLVICSAKLTWADEPTASLNLKSGTPGLVSLGTKALVLGSSGTGGIKFVVNGSTVETITASGLTGTLTLSNDSYLKATNAAGSGTDNLLKADSSDNTILNALTGKTVKIQVNATDELAVDGASVTLTTNNLVFGAAAAKIIPGATSLTFRNNADSSDNLAITDAGAVTTRAGITATTGNITNTAGNAVFGSSTAEIISNTADAADSKILCVGGGGACASNGQTRGGFAQFSGNESATTGRVDIQSGNVASANINLLTRAASTDITLGINATTEVDLDATNLTLATNNIVLTAGNLSFGAAAAKVLPGATSLTFRNNADSADNLAITDAGAITTRLGIAPATVNAGVVGSLALPYSGFFSGTVAIDADVTAVTGTDIGLTAAKNTSSNSDTAALIGYGANNNGATLRLFKTRAITTDANTIVAASDTIGTVDFSGADGASYRRAASISATVDATPGSSDMPGRLTFSTTLDGAASPLARWYIDNVGTFTSDATNGAGIVLAKTGANLTPIITGNATATLDTDLTARISTHAGLVVNQSGLVGAAAAFVANGADTNGPFIEILKTRATTPAVDANTIVANGDELGRIRFWGADGASFAQGALILVKVSAAPGSADMPASMDFQLSPDGSSTPASVLKLDQDKSALFTGTVRSSATADIGWSVVATAAASCNTTCTSACVAGFTNASGSAVTAVVSCTTSITGSCLCAGAS